MKPHLSKWLGKNGLNWADVQPALDLVDDTDALQRAIDDPEEFLDNLTTVSAAAGVKLAVVKLKPRLSRWLERHALEWTDVEPALDLVDSLDDLRHAIDFPEKFLDDLAAESVAAGMKLTVVKLKPRLGRWMARYDLKWGDVEPVLELVDSFDDLRRAVEDPEGFIEHLAAGTGKASVKLVVLKLKPRLGSWLKRRGRKWSHVQQVLELVDIQDRLWVAGRPDAILDDLFNFSTPALTKAAFESGNPTQFAEQMTKSLPEGLRRAATHLLLIGNSESSHRLSLVRRRTAEERTSQGGDPVPRRQLRKSSVQQCTIRSATHSTVASSRPLPKLPPDVSALLKHAHNRRGTPESKLRSTEMEVICGKLNDQERSILNESPATLLIHLHDGMSNASKYFLAFCVGQISVSGRSIVEHLKTKDVDFFTDVQSEIKLKSPKRLLLL
eukprot:3709341-Prymnesium_polylepis.2